MTTEPTTKKILANVDLDVYIGERNVFVKVGEPITTGENWPRIQQFYRWAAAEFGFKPDEIWDTKLGYAVLPLRTFKALMDDFSVRVVKKHTFFAAR